MTFTAGDDLVQRKPGSEYKLLDWAFKSYLPTPSERFSSSGVALWEVTMKLPITPFLARNEQIHQVVGYEIQLL